MATCPANGAATQVQDTNGTYYVHADDTHAPRFLTNSTGSVVWQARYQAYGAAAVGASAITYNQGRPGQCRDVESGLAYNRWRHYDPSIGRYAQKDPIGIGGGLNPYLYAAGNPASRWDPLGLCPPDVIPGIPDRTQPYTTQGSFTGDDGKQWYTFTATDDYEFDRSATGYNGSDASKGYTAPSKTITPSGSVSPSSSGQDNGPIRQISVSSGGEVRQGGPPGVDVHSTPPPAAPPPPPGPDLAPPNIDTTLPDIEVNFPE
jgi:RHS repeat-associated protein